MTPSALGMTLFLMGTYLLGSIPTGYWLGKIWKGVDVRQHGSGNLGATNVFRVLGTLPGFITLIVDILKGFVPVFWIKQHFPAESHLALLTAFIAIIGHTTSVFVRFKGGKGVATSAGAFLALLPGPSFVALAVFGLSMALTRIVSVSSMAGAMGLAASAFLFEAPVLFRCGALVMACFVVWTHRANIKRLTQGTEKKIV